MQETLIELLIRLREEQARTNIPTPTITPPPIFGSGFKAHIKLHVIDKIRKNFEHQFGRENITFNIIKDMELYKLIFYGYHFNISFSFDDSFFIVDVIKDPQTNNEISDRRRYAETDNMSHEIVEQNIINSITKLIDKSKGFE